MMQEALSLYIDSIRSIHHTETFWVVNSVGVIVYENEPKGFDIKSMRFYIDDNHVFLTWSDLIQSSLIGKFNDRKQEVVAIFSKENELVYYLFEVKKLFAKGKTIGALITNAGNLANFEYINLLNHICFSGKRKILEVNLTSRELEIVYFIIRGKTYVEIADILTNLYKKPISASSIGKMVRGSLYDKFNVWNKFELKQLLLHSNYVNKIPPTIYKNLLHSNSSIKEYTNENS